MTFTLTTSHAARKFAERLMQEVPNRDSSSASCADKGAHDHGKECAGSAMHACGHDLSKERELFERSLPDKYRACTMFREEAKAAFTSQQYKLAEKFYEKILIQLDYTFADDADWKAKFREMELSTHVNLALTKFRLQEFRKAIYHCKMALFVDPTNVKALVRRGLCYMSLCSYDEAEKDFLKALEIDSECATARSQLSLIGKRRAAGQKSERLVCSAMFSANKASSSNASGGEGS
ncbi:hypothetical protein, conserved [Babesia bigemina]|uniref:Uncharacterized protein n=1 Tax=Babesia bigemina TaxID=5866 RepID=A0A061DAE4_BABBI|nr:hypothetical protein, conserved [Babesia bigemina]CDR94700.1 hypothetical protein, conserved [Babesia bigemina]|eukprot:XP_012766886.1 hypothetical protein, conserved [Babesia bigemina]